MPIFTSEQSAALLQTPVVDTWKSSLRSIHDRLDSTGEAAEALTAFYNALLDGYTLNVATAARVERHVERSLPALEESLREKAKLMTPTVVGGLVADRLNLVNAKVEADKAKVVESIRGQVHEKSADEANAVAKALAETAQHSKDQVQAAIVACCNPATLLLGGKRGLVDLQKIVMVRDASKIMSPGERAETFKSYVTLGQTSAAEDFMLANEPEAVDRITAIRGTLNLSNGKNANLDAAVSASDEYNGWFALLQMFSDFRRENMPEWLPVAVSVLDDLQESFEALVGPSATFSRRTPSADFPASYAGAILPYSPMSVGAAVCKGPVVSKPLDDAALKAARARGYSWR